MKTSTSDRSQPSVEDPGHAFGDGGYARALDAQLERTQSLVVQLSKIEAQRRLLSSWDTLAADDRQRDTALESAKEGPA